MPLYDCMLLFKPHIKKEPIMDLVARVGKHVYRRNGVLTDIKSFGTVQLGYGIKKLDGRFYQGQMMQMIMMATPNINKELHYLNKEDRLLRWVLVKHRTTQYGIDFFNQEQTQLELSRFPRSGLFNDEFHHVDLEALEDYEDDQYEVEEEGDEEQHQVQEEGEKLD